jgi:transposase
MIKVDPLTQTREKALKMVSSGKMSLRKAAKIYGISKSALSRMQVGETLPETRKGAPTHLPPEVEALLAEKLLLCAERAFAVSVSQLPLIAQEIGAKLGIPVGDWYAGEKWQRGFLKRHPFLSSRKASRVNRARTLGFTSVSHAEYYATLKPILPLFKPSELFNVDDTSIDPEKGGMRVRFIIAAAHPYFAHNFASPSPHPQPLNPTCPPLSRSLASAAGTSPNSTRLGAAATSLQRSPRPQRARWRRFCGP